MYIERLTIKNFRCFGHSRVSFNYPMQKQKGDKEKSARLDNVNLFLGGNGAGKSSVFKAAVLGVLSPILRSTQLPPAYFVRRANTNPEQTLQSEAETESLIRTGLRISPDDANGSALIHFDLSLTLKISLIGDVEEFVGPPTLNKQAAMWSSLYHNDSPGFLLIAYGAGRRTERPEGYSETTRTPRYQRVAGLFEDHVGLVPFTFATLQLAQRARLEEARGLLNHLLPGSVQLKTESDTQGTPLFDVSGVRLPFAALSDGYRAFVGWVWDLLLQLARVAPEGTALTDLPGVVIVDEIDLFLHPEWQRRVVEQVATTFPKLQFLFSTHSPLVAGSLEARNIFVLDTDEEGAAIVRQYDENIYGLTASQVLTSSYFGLHSTRAPNTGTLEDLAEDMLRKAMSGDEDAAREYLKQRQAAVTPE